jgi:hypothetical protein
MPPPARRFIPHAILLSTFFLALAGSSLAAAWTPLPNREDEFNAPGFVARNIWTKLAYSAMEPFRTSLSEAEKDALVARYFGLNELIRHHVRIADDAETAPDAARAAERTAAQLRDERAAIERSVESVLSGRLKAVIKDAGLTRRFGTDVVWPPVSIVFDEPPAVLVESARDEIRQTSARLLDADTPPDRRRQVEADAESDGETSALVVNIGGIAMYPAIIPRRVDYRSTLHVIAHEWAHHYLFFAPLGRKYWSSAELITLNETAADIIGRELGEMMFERYPLPEPTGGGLHALAVPAAAPGIDVTATMRGLRAEVEQLLEDGRIAEAEELMETTRTFMADNGHYIRRLNQAYFAFHGSYAGRAASIDPIGATMASIRRESASLAEFTEIVRDVTSAAELERALEAR